MTGLDLIAEVARHGASLTVEAGRLRVQASEPLPRELSSALRAHRVELAALLSGSALHQPSTDTALCPTCEVRPVPRGRPCFARCAVCVRAAWLVIERGTPPYIVTQRDIDAAHVLHDGDATAIAWRADVVPGVEQGQQ